MKAGITGRVLKRVEGIITGTMGGTEPNNPKSNEMQRSINQIRAAAAATLIAGGLTIVYAFGTILMARDDLDRIAASLDLFVGLVICALGLLSLRIHRWSPWATTCVMAAFLAGQLYEAYSNELTVGPQLSVFMLVVPLIVLVFNTLAIGAVRSLPPEPQAKA